MMPIITLTTDFGVLDHRVASIKGSILNLQPNANIVDITHNIEPYNLIQTSYILKNTYYHFPKGSIHIISVDSAYHKDRKFLIINVDDHYFIMSDNGLYSLIFQGIKPEKIYEITINNRFDDVVNFTPIDIFVPVAVHLSKGGVPEIVGRELTEIKEVIPIKPEFNEEQKTLIGEIIYIDHFGNAITNISNEVFNKYLSAYQGFTIKLRKTTEIKKIVSKYTDIIPNWSEENEFAGKVLALFNESQLLEIALYKGSKNNGASSLLGLNIGSKIFVKFS